MQKNYLQRRSSGFNYTMHFKLENKALTQFSDFKRPRLNTALESSAIFYSKKYFLCYFNVRRKEKYVEVAVIIKKNKKKFFKMTFSTEKATLNSDVAEDLGLQNRRHVDSCEKLTEQGPTGQEIKATNDFFFYKKQLCKCSKQ